MNSSFQGIRRALVLVPHPDDEALGCAGTIMLLNRQGTSCSIVFLTDGERLLGEPSPEIAEQRREEGVRASRMLDCSDPVFLGFPDGGLAGCSQVMHEKLTEIIALIKPDILFAPSPVDYHQDHIALSKTALDLFIRFKSFELAFYEVYATLRFNYLIDITEVSDQKKQVILNYRRSLYQKPEIYVSGALGLNAHRALFVQKEGYFEAFYVAGKDDDMRSICDHLSYRDFHG